MTHTQQLQRLLQLVALGVAWISTPAWAVVTQSVAFPDANIVQGGTLTLDGTPYPGEVRDEDGEKLLVFTLPDDAMGAEATVVATVDGRRETRSITVTGNVVTLMTVGAASTARSGGFFFGVDAALSSYSTDVASNLASTSAADATALLTDFGLQNIAATSSGDDSDTLLGVGILAGYQFPNGSEISLQVERPISNIELDLSATATGDLPGVLVTAQSTATVELEILIATLNYAGYFGDSNFRYILSGGGLILDRETSFTSSVDINNVVNSFSGGDNLEDSQLFYGGAIEWMPRNRSGWVPFIGIGVSQSASSGDLENEKLSQFGVWAGYRLQPRTYGVPVTKPF